MHPEEPASFNLQAHIEELAQTARRLAAGTPARAEGTDATGCARVAVGPDALPIDIRVVDHWRRLCTPDTLAAAVLQANDDAIRSAVAAWSANQNDIRPRHQAEQTGAPSADARPRGEVSETTDLAERAITALQQVQRPIASAPAAYTGADDMQNVAVHLGPGGLTGCVIDPRWAASQDGATITAALTTALRHATAGHTAAAPPAADLDALLSDALATFYAITDQPTTGGEAR